MGGIDLDILRCRLAIGDQEVGRLSATITNLETDLAMARNDLTSVRKALEDEKKRWADYSRPLWDAAPDK